MFKHCGGKVRRENVFDQHFKRIFWYTWNRKRILRNHLELVIIITIFKSLITESTNILTSITFNGKLLGNKWILYFRTLPTPPFFKPVRPLHSPSGFFLSQAFPVQFILHYGPILMFIQSTFVHLMKLIDWRALPPFRNLKTRHGSLGVHLSCPWALGTQGT